MSNQKSKAQPQAGSLYKAESVKYVAESLGIMNLSDSICSALSNDVEYRIHQVIEEATRYMRHARRTTMTTDDIDRALQALNIEPVYGHSPYNFSAFRSALPLPKAPSAGTVHFAEDEVIDLGQVINEEKVPLPKPPNWTAHWLAVDGVMPLVPENPIATPRGKDRLDAVGTKLAATTLQEHGVSKDVLAQIQPTLSRELRLFYFKLISTLLPAIPTETDDACKAAALSSLRKDASLQPLLPHLIKWVGDGVVRILKNSRHEEDDGIALEVYLEVIDALLDNQILFVESSLHKILPTILSTLLHISLPQSHSAQIRILSAQALSHLLTDYSPAYPSLSSRIMETLLPALLSPGKNIGTREGAVRGLMAVGREAVRVGLIDKGGARTVGNECASGGNASAPETAQLLRAFMDAFRLLAEPSPKPRPLHPSNPDDATFMADLLPILGRFFAARVSHDGEWIRKIIAKKQYE